MKHESMQKLFDSLSDEEAARFFGHLDCINMKMSQVMRDQPHSKSEFADPGKVCIYAVTLFQLQGAVIRFLSDMFDVDTEDE